MADVVNSHLLGMDPVADPGEIIGWGKALELFSVVNPGNIYESAITDLIGKLETAQYPDGHWDGENSEGSQQDTAYAIMGLKSVGATEIARKGVSWLIENQKENGGWLTGLQVEYSESDSEALQALCRMTKAYYVPGKGKGLYKPIPNDNFAKGRRE